MQTCRLWVESYCYIYLWLSALENGLFFNSAEISNILLMRGVGDTWRNIDTQNDNRTLEYDPLLARPTCTSEADDALLPLGIVSANERMYRILDIDFLFDRICLPEGNIDLSSVSHLLLSINIHAFWLIYSLNNATPL